jgi:hypothetical protein
MGAMNHKVFICYAHSDVGYADSICRKLEGSGIICWMAPRDISPSKDWAEEIIDAISSAVIMVFVFSSNSNHSPQVRREVERAVNKGVRILPLRVEDVPLSKSLEYFVSTPHWLDAVTPPFEAHLDKLRECVEGVLAGLSVDCSPKVTPTISSAPSKSTPPVSIARAAEAFAQHDLKYIETQLASYLGPLAKVLVTQAAKKTSSIEELVSLLANELKLDTEKKSFHENCRFLEK